MKNQENKNKLNPFGLIIIILFIAFSIHIILGGLLIIVIILILIKNPKSLNTYITQYSQMITKLKNLKIENKPALLEELSSEIKPIIPAKIENILFKKIRLEKRKKYLHIALNSTLEEAGAIILQLPSSDRILIEVGTPLIKIHGIEAISLIKGIAPAGTYIVADNKCTDLAVREVEMMANAGANASTCLGIAPIETIDNFIEKCQRFNIDSMLDMMNVEDSLSVLKKLKKLPDVVILHRGVDETELTKEKQIPFYQIKQIKGSYNILVAVAGGDTIKEVQRAIFNDADIVVVWKNFYQSNTETTKLAESFLREIK